MLRFLSVIRHWIPRYNHAFTEKAQHLRRWIPLQTFTRGRLVPRQPRAIKGTTRTELRGYNIQNGWYIHWNINIIPMVLHRYNIRHCEYIHLDIGITPTFLCHYNIQNSRYIHWNINITPTALHSCNIQNGGYIHWNADITPMALHDDNIMVLMLLIINDKMIWCKWARNLPCFTRWNDAKHCVICSILQRGG